MPYCVLSLGSNISPRSKAMAAMRSALEALLSETRYSTLWETAPLEVDSTLHGAYLNQLCYGFWPKDVWELLEATQAIELSLGRQGKGAYAPRTADIDILLVEDLRVMSPELVIPHHALEDRYFHILGLKELVPQWKVPSRNNQTWETYPISDMLLRQKVRALACEL